VSLAWEAFGPNNALAAKMKLNAERHPAGKARGKNLKHGDL
jgi:hypothetical protein